MAVSNSRDASSLAIAMIVRDAEELLCQTFESIRPITDNIVILDTGSSDRTIAVAKRAGATVYELSWDDDFAAARNACAARVAADWILWIDAGETIDTETASQIREFVATDAKTNKAYMLFVESPPTTRNLSGEQIGQIRLVPNLPGLKFVGRLRETIAPSILAAGLEVDALPCRIVRPMSDHSPAIKEAKARRNLAILAVAENRPNQSDIAAAHDYRDYAASMLLAQAQARQSLNDRTAAREYYREAIDSATDGSSAMLEGYYGLLTTYDGQTDEAETQIAVCLEALDVFPLDAQLLCGMGSYLLNQRRLDLAARSYEIAATHGQIDPSTWHLDDISEVAANCLSLAHQLRGDAEAAIGVLTDALVQRPNSIRMRRQLIDLYIKNHRRDDAMAAFDSLPDEVPNREALRSAIRGALLASEKNFAAAEPYLKTAFSAGCRDAICLRWLVITYLSTGNAEAAAPIIAQWRALDPIDAESAAYEKAVQARQGGVTPDRKPRSRIVPRPKHGTQPERTGAASTDGSNWNDAAGTDSTAGFDVPLSPIGLQGPISSNSV